MLFTNACGSALSTSASLTVNAGAVTKLQILLPGEEIAQDNVNGKAGTPLPQKARAAAGDPTSTKLKRWTPSWSTGSLLPNASATDNTLRWSGTAWVESSSVKSSASGQVTVSAGVTLGGTSSPIVLNASAGTSGATLTLFVLATKLTTAANAIFLQSTYPLYVLLDARGRIIANSHDSKPDFDAELAKLVALFRWCWNIRWNNRKLPFDSTYKMLYSIVSATLR